ncbi:hypothetical protein PUN4_270002 [Paraburkholderia unamae]|nr:hypothetical protein PUN4_270002 [Paraburkholderia unamae]
MRHRDRGGQPEQFQLEPAARSRREARHSRLYGGRARADRPALARGQAPHRPHGRGVGARSARAGDHSPSARTRCAQRARARRHRGEHCVPAAARAGSAGLTSTPVCMSAKNAPNGRVFLRLSSKQRDLNKGHIKEKCGLTVRRPGVRISVFARVRHQITWCDPKFLISLKRFQRQRTTSGRDFYVTP